MTSSCWGFLRLIEHAGHIPAVADGVFRQACHWQQQLVTFKLTEAVNGMLQTRQSSVRHRLHSLCVYLGRCGDPTARVKDVGVWG